MTQTTTLRALPLLALAGCLTVPLTPDLAGYDQFVPSLPTGVDLSVVPLQVGHQTAPRCAAAGEASCLGTGRIVYAAFLVRHPKGTFLIDAALAESSRANDVAPMPLQRGVFFDFTVDGKLKDLLAAQRVSPDFVLLTHAHWDHTSGLVDLGNPRVVMGPGELEYVKHPTAPSTVLPWHLRGSRLESFSWDGPPYENFPRSHDWFGDGSVVLVPLPGHTPGSIGIFLNSVHGQRVFFVGDTAWSMDAIELPSHKLSPMSDFADSDTNRLSEALWRIHHLHTREPEVLIVPAHDGAALEKVRALSVAVKP